jgi:hypothetical protein
MSVTSRQSQGNWYREPMVWLVILIPLSSVVMGVVMLALAISTDDGLVVDDYYNKGLEINRSLERDRLAEHLAVGAEIVFDAGQVQVDLRGSDALSYPDYLNLRLFHATRSGLDRHLVLGPRGTREYATTRPELAAGRWYIQLDADGWRLTGALEASPDRRLVRLGAVKP